MAHGHSHEPVPQESLQREHEQRDLSVRAAILGLAALIMSTAAAALAMAGLFAWMESRAAAGDAAAPLAGPADKIPPQPRLETKPSTLLEQLRGSETYLLDGYSWVDRDAGAARIPLARAMDIIAEHGLPDWSTASTDITGQTGTTGQQ